MIPEKLTIKKVREGQWLIPQGYKNITTQSIRQKEEQEHIEKKEQYAKDAQIFKNIVEVVNTEKPYISLKDRLLSYKESLNANQKGMPNQNI